MIMELKLNKLPEDVKEARQEIKNELKSFIRSGDPKAKAKAKCLQLIGNLKDAEDDDFARLQGRALLMPQFLQNMQERALERSIKHEQESHLGSVTHSNGGEKFYCEECETRLKSFGGLQRHQLNCRLKPPSLRPSPHDLKCKICLKLFPNTKTLYSHKRTHDIMQDRDGSGQAVCNICSTVFTSAKNLNIISILLSGNGIWCCYGKKRNIKINQQKYSLITAAYQQQQQQYNFAALGKNIKSTITATPTITNEIAATASQPTQYATNSSSKVTTTPLTVK